MDKVTIERLGEAIDQLKGARCALDDVLASELTEYMQKTLGLIANALQASDGDLSRIHKIYTEEDDD